MLSAYQLQIIEDNNFSLGKNERLILNLDNKKIQTPSLLKTLFRVWVTIKKIHSIRIKQSTFLKPHIELNTEYAEKDKKKATESKTKMLN